MDYNNMTNKEFLDMLGFNFPFLLTLFEEYFNLHMSNIIDDKEYEFYDQVYDYWEYIKTNPFKPVVISDPSLGEAMDFFNLILFSFQAMVAAIVSLSSEEFLQLIVFLTEGNNHYSPLKDFKKDFNDDYEDDYND